MKPLLTILMVLAAAQAQDSKTPEANVSVSGTVRDAVTGQPLPGFNVSTFVNATWVDDTIYQTRTTKELNSVTDEQGKYRLGDLPPGPYRIEVRNREFGSSLTRHIAVAGHDLDGIDFSVKVDGFVSGKVVDENKEPVPGINVWLVSREYYRGVLGYFLSFSAMTDDRGVYNISRVKAGQPYLIMAEKVDRRLPAHSDVPLDAKLRRHAPTRTFYPNTPDRDGGTPVIIRPGEHREGVDIELKKTANYCLDGVTSGAAGPSTANFTITPLQPSDGQSNGHGLMAGMPGGNTGPDGSFRICNLSPGTYRLEAWEGGSGQGLSRTMGNHAFVPISIKDEDIRNLRVNLTPGPNLSGEGVLEGPVPVDSGGLRVNVGLVPMLRSNMVGENFSTRCELPSCTFTFTGLVPGDYEVRASMNAPGYYVKEISWAGNSVRYEPLHAGSAMPAVPLRVTVAGDGATLMAKVSDKDGNPQSDIQVLVLPHDITSEAMLQAAMVRGVTDQTGAYHSHTLAPGPYYILATNDAIDSTPESIRRLWRARNHFQEVDLSPKGSSQVALQPVQIPQ